MTMEKKINSKALKNFIIITSLISVCFSVMYYFYLLEPLLDVKYSFGQAYIFLIFFLVLLFILHVLIHESGHLIFGKLSGYDFISFRLLSFIIYKENGKLKARKSALGIKGILGQCLMLPRCGIDDSFNYKLYLSGGLILNALTAVICLLLFLLLKAPAPLAAAFMFLGFFIALIMLLNNGIPYQTNDVNAIRFISEDKVALRSLWVQLNYMNFLANGGSPGDIPLEWMQSPNGADFSNYFHCFFRLLEIDYMDVRGDYRKCADAIAWLLENAPDMPELTVHTLKCERIFYELMGERRSAIMNFMFTKEGKKSFKVTANLLSTRRCMYAYERLFKRDEKSALKHMAQFNKLAKSYPYEAVVALEREKIKQIDNIFMQSAHY